MVTGAYVGMVKVGIGAGAGAGIGAGAGAGQPVAWLVVEAFGTILLHAAAKSKGAGAEVVDEEAGVD